MLERNAYNDSLLILVMIKLQGYKVEFSISRRSVALLLFNIIAAFHNLPPLSNLMYEHVSWLHYLFNHLF